MFRGKEDALSAQRLMNGEEGIIVGFGQSMTPKLQSGQPVRVVPVKNDTQLKKGDIVLCKVNGHYYLHLISAIKGIKQYQISNNHKHVNGTINRKNIYGKVVEILPKNYFAISDKEDVKNT